MSAPKRVPSPGPGQQVFLLDVPWEERALASAAGAEWFPHHGHAYVGEALPKSLRRYSPQRYSWGMWRQQDLTGHTQPVPAPDNTTGTFTLRTDQMQDIKTLLLARRAGAPEVLVGNDVGTGKTLIAISAIKRMANVKNVLIICPLTVAPNWRIHLDRMGDGGKRWCIINYESARKLLTPPPSADKAKRTRTKNLHTANHGTPIVEWDAVVIDEAHYCGNPESLRSRIVDRVIAGTRNRPAFTFRMSATAGSDPSQLSYLHRGLFWGDGLQPRTHIDIDGYVDWCASHALNVTRNGYGSKLKWEGEGDADLKRLSKLLYGGTTPWGIRRRPDWPEQQRIAMPVELGDDELEAYEADWAEFQTTMKRIEREKRANAAKQMTRQNRARADATARTKGLAAQTRYRQKAGQVRAPGTAAFVVEMLAKGRQVAVSCEYLGTVHRLVEELQARKVRVVTYTGENRDTRETDRIAYQQGHAQVIIYTPTEGFNLHAGETSVSGNTTPRITVIAEPRWSPKKALQAEGRSQRDGTEAPVYYPYAVGTVEEDVIKKVVWGMKNTTIINGDDTAAFDGLAETLRVPFLVAA